MMNLFDAARIARLLCGKVLNRYKATSFRFIGSH